MNLRVTLLLLVVVAALAGLLLLTQQKPDTPIDTTTSLLDHHVLGHATKLSWQLEGQPPIEVQRVEHTFWITQPIRDLASRARLVAIASAYDHSTVQQAFGDRTVDADLLQQTGMTPPVARFTAWFEDGKQVSLDIGGLGSSSGERFVRRDGVLYRGAEALYSSLQMTLEDLREHLLFVNTPETARQITVDHETATGAREKLVLQNDGRWKLVAPIASRTEAAATQTFLRVLLGLRIDMFMASLARPQERPPDVVIDVTGDFGDESIKLWRDQRSGSYLGRQDARDIDFQVDATQIADLFDTALQNMRARWLFAVRDFSSDLVRVVIDQGQDQPRLRLERLNGEAGFRILEPVEAIADDTTMAELVQALKNCRVLQFVDGKPSEPRFGLTGEGLEVAVQDNVAPVMTRLKIGSDDSIGEMQISYAMRVDEPDQVFAIPQPVGKRLRRHWSEYVRTKVLGQPLPPVTRMVARRGDKTLVFAADGSKWFLQDGTSPQQKLPNEDVAELVPELRDLRSVNASLLQPPRDPDWTVALERQEGDQLLLLRVFERGADQPVWLQPAGTTKLLYEPKRDVSRRLHAVRALFGD